MEWTRTKLKEGENMPNKKQSARSYQPTRRPDYPQWGVEIEPRIWGEHSKYRGGKPDFLCKYILPPKSVPILDYGVTVLDLIACVGVAAFMVLGYLAVCAGIDGYLNVMGW